MNLMVSYSTLRRVNRWMLEHSVNISWSPLGKKQVLAALFTQYGPKLTQDIDHVQMTALTRVLKINVNVAYLDGHAHQNGEVNFVTFDNAIGPEEPINLLYRYAEILSALHVYRSQTFLDRPGHYDILDSKDREDLTLDPLW